ncbi:MAG: polysaccharide deacetylase family protein [Candidatus Delongbacteria bacterium]
MDIFYRPPKIFRIMFPGMIWENNEDKILLTIDDGPSEFTHRILDVLDRFRIKAVFFCTAKNIEKYFNETNAIIRSGHKIQNHGYTHKRMIFRSKSFNFRELKKSTGIIKDITGESPRFFRPPYGLFNKNTLDAVRMTGSKMMMWSFLSGDHTADFADVRRLTDTYLKKNSIIVMHDNKKSAEIFEDSLGYIVRAAKDRGYSFSLF